MAKAKKARKKKSDKGEVIRVSREVYNQLTKAALDKDSGKKEPFDVVLRNLLGIKQRKGTATKKVKPLRTFWALPEVNIVRETQAEIRGDAILHSIRRGKKRVVLKPVKVREVL